MPFDFLKSILDLTRSLKGVLLVAVVSIFQSTAAVNVKCFKIRFIPLFAILFGLTVQGQQSDMIQREALFERAYKSLSFILSSLYTEPAFAESLTADERKMLEGILDVSLYHSMVNLLSKNKIAVLGPPENSGYTYVIYGNQKITIPAPSYRPFQLRFSDDQSLFTLGEKQNVRTGVTTPEVSSDIIINLLKINASDADIDFFAAISLMTHEFGHKLGKAKIQSAVDSLAAKVEQTLKSQSTIATLHGVKITALGMRFPFDIWLSQILGGELVRPQSYLTSVDKQGLYVLIDDGFKVSDISDEVIEDFSRSYKDVPVTKNENYQYLQQSLVLGSLTQVEMDEKDQIKLTVNGEIVKAVIPFLTRTHSNPFADNLYRTSFNEQKVGVARRRRKQLTLDAKSYKIVASNSIVQQEARPDIKINLLEKKKIGKNLQISYQLLGSLRLKSLENAELWPELKVMVDNTTLLIPATDYNERTQLFDFILNDYDAISHKDVRVVEAYLKPKKHILPMDDYNLQGTVFLAQQEVLSKKDISKVSTPSKPILKSIQIWDGQQWISYKARKVPLPGSHIRLVFDSVEDIRQISLYQSFENAIESKPKSETYSAFRSIYRDTEPGERTMTFDQSSFRQIRRGRFVYVDLDIDHQTQTHFQFEVPWVYRTKPPTPYRPLLEADLQTHQTKSERALKGFVSVVLSSGYEHKFLLKNSVQFTKINELTTPSETLLLIGDEKNSKLIPKCQSLF